MPTCPREACILPSIHSLSTASSQGKSKKTSLQARVSILRKRKRIRPILHFGRPQKKTSPGGRAPGAEDVRDGTLNALRWQSGISVKLLTFTAAALILSFL